ncbi:response regulator [Deinococcus sonorensis]|uniref:Response regulator n=2 Tax=Deinococcus sonorensis TaxID=309891 RepID=A0AAU7UG79_9DEIO
MASSRTLHLLLVDDSEQDQLLVTSVLQQLKPAPAYRTVQTCEEALELLRKLSEVGEPLPDLLLLDLHLPRMNGPELLQCLKADPTFASMPVIVFSTSASARDIRQCYLERSAAYMVKPIEFTQLAEALECLVAFWGNPAVRLPSHVQRARPASTA